MGFRSWNAKEEKSVVWRFWKSKRFGGLRRREVLKASVRFINELGKII